MTHVKRESFGFAGGIRMLVSGAAQDNGTTVRRWLLVASAAPEAVPNLATLIRVEVPEAARAVYTDAVVRQMGRHRASSSSAGTPHPPARQRASGSAGCRTAREAFVGQ